MPKREMEERERKENCGWHEPREKAKEKDRAAVLAFYVLDISSARATLRETYPGIRRQEVPTKAGPRQDAG